MNVQRMPASGWTLRLKQTPALRVDMRGITPGALASLSVADIERLPVGLGNAPSSIPVLEALKARRDYPSELVREHVEWALNQHATRQCSSL